MFPCQSKNTLISSVLIRRNAADGYDDAERKKIIEHIDESQNRVLRYHQIINNGLRCCSCPEKQQD